MKRVLLAVLPVVMFVAVAQAELTGNPIPIGIGVAQTGNVALLGQEEVDGAKLAEKYFNANGGINGTPFKLIFQDVIYRFFRACFSDTSRCRNYLNMVFFQKAPRLKRKNFCDDES